MSKKPIRTVPLAAGADNPPDFSLSVLLGTLSSEPRQRELPSGSTLLTLEVTCQQADANALSVSVAMFDPPKTLGKLCANARVVVVGQTRRRFFRAGGATVSRTEIVARKVIPVSQSRRAATALHAAASEVETVARCC